MSMDRVFKSDKYAYTSQPIDFGSFLNDAVATRDKLEKTLCTLRVGGKEQELSRFCTIMKLDTGSGKIILDSLNNQLESLNVPTDQYSFDTFEGPEDEAIANSKLRTLEYLKEERDRRLNTQYRSVVLRNLKYDRYHPDYLRLSPFAGGNGTWGTKEEVIGQLNNYRAAEQTGATATSSCESLGSLVGPGISTDCVLSSDNLRPPFRDSIMSDLKNMLRSQRPPWGDDEIILDISVFIGYDRELTKPEIRLGRCMKLTDRFWVRGSDTFMSLRERIMCPRDYEYVEDFSENQAIEDDLCLKQFTSSFFFIHDTVYVDSDTPNAQDITGPVLAWAERQERSNIEPFHRQSMRMKFRDLICRLGQAYVFVHQGCCEHLLIVNDARLRSMTDPQDGYPIQLVARDFRRRQCSSGCTSTAEYRITSCESLPSEISHLCSSCYASYLHTPEGYKNLPFIAAPYIDRQAFASKELFEKLLTHGPTLQLPKVDDEEEEDDFF